VALKRDNVKINYLSRDFQSIKADLIDYAKRYYPDTFQDFSDAGFGALMVDAVSYIGDIVSYYLDYQANESFLATAIEYENIIKHGATMGYAHQGARATYGIVSVYVLVPVNSGGTGPDRDYMPVLKAGSAFTSVGGANFTLLEDINFADGDNEVVVAKTNSTTGAPTSFAVKASGPVVSGETRTKKFKNIGEFVKFRRLSLRGNNITEIISVADSEGKRYYEVENLSQNIVYIPISNTDTTTNVQAPNILKPVIVPRRYRVERNRFTTDIVFGYGSDSELANSSFAEPRDIVLDIHSKSYVTDVALDPSVLIKTDKFGVGPSNTNITVTYRANTAANSNAAATTVKNVGKGVFIFANRNTLVNAKMQSVRNSLEVNNEKPIQGDISPPNITELRELIQGVYSAQNRVVTAEDYKAFIYTMPARFGGVSRCTVMQDVDANLRNINIYVISRSTNGYLQATNEVVKQNVKTYISSKRMINDSVDILDAKIVNLGISFEVISSLGANKSKVLNRCVLALKAYVDGLYEIGEDFSISDIYSTLNSVTGVVDTTKVKMFQKNGVGYSTTIFNVKNHTTTDGRFVKAPKNVIFEVKYPNSDIQGTIK
jgi:phage-related baseplate assembly protein